MITRTATNTTAASTAAATTATAASMNTTASSVSATVDLWRQCLTSNNEGVEFMKSRRYEDASTALIRSLGAAKSILYNHQQQQVEQRQRQQQQQQHWTRYVVGDDADEGSCKFSSLPILTTSLNMNNHHNNYYVDVDMNDIDVDIDINIDDTTLHQEHRQQERNQNAAQDTIEEEEDEHDDLRGVYMDMYAFPHLPTAKQLTNGCTESCLDTLCMVIVFNLALSHHLRAASLYRQHGHDVQWLRSSDNDINNDDNNDKSWTTNISNAIALYELVYNMQQQRNQDWTTGSCLHGGLREELYLAILCNLGHAHTLLGQNEKASAFYQHLLAVMVFLQSSTQSGGNGSAGVGMMRHDHDGTARSSSARETFSWCICSKVLEKNNTAPAA